jgi:drug/metabolite transporter (DMT)-like permease
LPLLSRSSAPAGLLPTASAATARRDAPARTDDPLRGILLVVGASLLFSASDATAKFVSQSLPPIEITWFRYLVFLALTLPAGLRHGGAALHTRRPTLQIGRGLAVTLSAILFVFALRVLPMADAAAINFVSPLFITMLSVPMLGEQVGMRRWIAVAAGLIGAVIAAQPGTSAFSPAAALPVISAATWAIGIIWTRRMAASERPTTTLVWSAGSGLVLLSCLLPLDFRVPSLAEFGLCMVIGLVASVGQGMVVLGYRQAPASLLAPFSYLQLIWSTALGYVVFNGRPSLPTIIGATVIAASGLYSAHGVRRRAAAR